MAILASLTHQRRSVDDVAFNTIQRGENREEHQRGVAARLDSGEDGEGAEGAGKRGAITAAPRPTVVRRLGKTSSGTVAVPSTTEGSRSHPYALPSFALSQARMK